MTTINYVRVPQRGVLAQHHKSDITVKGCQLAFLCSWGVGGEKKKEKNPCVYKLDTAIYAALALIPEYIKPNG